MTRKFDHFLSYGSTDQQTVRDLARYYSGLLVPGTVAAFQAEGTKGFVLSLSARSTEPYMIDSRFPLFQNELRTPKKSHLMLADVFGSPELVQRSEPLRPHDFNPSLVERISSRWVDFNVNFDDVKSKTFDKYASRLNEEVLPQNRRGPSWVLPPYAMVSHLDDGWLRVSDDIWDASNSYANTRRISTPLRRVVAATSAEVWDACAAHVQSEDLIAWVDNLEEFPAESREELFHYGNALLNAKARGQSVFALYGGFFSVLLARCGLIGSSHGIGFGEHRHYIELPSSGAPPARYYVPKLHRYISVDLAQVLWAQFRDLVICDCSECADTSPIALDYHALMRHSVRARYQEISDWVSKPTAQTIADLRAEYLQFRRAVALLEAPRNVIRRAEGIYHHLEMWADVLSRLQEERGI